MDDSRPWYTPPAEPRSVLRREQFQKAMSAVKMGMVGSAFVIGGMTHGGGAQGTMQFEHPPVGQHHTP